MSKKNIDHSVESRVCFEQLEEWVREQIQFYVQELLEDEVTQLLGRRKNERPREVDAPGGYRNGYGKERRLTLSCGTIKLRRPRVRDLEERFESRVLPLFASTVARLKQKWQGEMEAWQSRRLDDLEVVYLWADGVYIKAGLEKEKAVILVVIAALSDGIKVVVSVSSGYRESTQSWSEVLRYLKERGMNPPRLVIADGHLGIWGALRNVFPEADEQRCWNHRIVNLLAKIPKGRHKAALLMLRQIPYAETRQEAERVKGRFQHWCGKRGLEAAADLIDQGWDRMVTFYNYPKQQWQHLRTTHPVESPFSALRLRTDAARRFKKVANARAVIWKMLLVAEKRFRRLKAPHLMKDVYQGAQYANGVPVNQVTQEKAA